MYIVRDENDLQQQIRWNQDEIITPMMNFCENPDLPPYDEHCQGMAKKSASIIIVKPIPNSFLFGFYVLATF